MLGRKTYNNLHAKDSVFIVAVPKAVSAPVYRGWASGAPYREKEKKAALVSVSVSVVPDPGLPNLSFYSETAAVSSLSPTFGSPTVLTEPPSRCFTSPDVGPDVGPVASPVAARSSEQTFLDFYTPTPEEVVACFPKTAAANIREWIAWRAQCSEAKGGERTPAAPAFIRDKARELLHCRVLIIVGPSGSGKRALVRAVADKEGVEVVEPPNVDSIQTLLRVTENGVCSRGLTRRSKKAKYTDDEPVDAVPLWLFGGVDGYVMTEALNSNSNSNNNKNNTTSPAADRGGSETAAFVPASAALRRLMLIWGAITDATRCIQCGAKLAAADPCSCEKKSNLELFRHLPPVILTIQTFPDCKLMHALRTAQGIPKIYLGAGAAAAPQSRKAMAGILERIARAEACPLRAGTIQGIVLRSTGDWRQTVADLESVCAATRACAGPGRAGGTARPLTAITVTPSHFTATVARALWQHVHVLNRLDSQVVLKHSVRKRSNTADNTIILHDFLTSDAKTACFVARRELATLRIHNVLDILGVYEAKIKVELFDGDGDGSGDDARLAELELECRHQVHGRCLIVADAVALDVVIDAHFRQLRLKPTADAVIAYYCSEMMPDFDRIRRYIAVRETLGVYNAFRKRVGGMGGAAGAALFTRHHFSTALHPDDAAMVSEMMERHHGGHALSGLTAARYYAETVTSDIVQALGKLHFWAWRLPATPDEDIELCLTFPTTLAAAGAVAARITKDIIRKPGAGLAKDAVYSSPFDLAKAVLNGRDPGVEWDQALTSSLADRLLWENAYADFKTDANFNDVLEIVEAWSTGDHRNSFRVPEFSAAMWQRTVATITHGRRRESVCVLDEYTRLALSTDGGAATTALRTLRDLQQGCIETATHSRQHTVDAFQLMRLRKVEAEHEVKKCRGRVLERLSASAAASAFPTPTGFSCSMRDDVLYRMLGFRGELLNGFRALPDDGRRILLTTTGEDVATASSNGNGRPLPSLSRSGSGSLCRFSDGDISTAIEREKAVEAWHSESCSHSHSERKQFAFVWRGDSLAAIHGAGVDAPGDDHATALKAATKPRTATTTGEAALAVAARAATRTRAELHQKKLRPFIRMAAAENNTCCYYCAGLLRVSAESESAGAQGDERVFVCPRCDPGLSTCETVFRGNGVSYEHLPGKHKKWFKDGILHRDDSLPACLWYGDSMGYDQRETVASYYCHGTLVAQSSAPCILHQVTNGGDQYTWLNRELRRHRDADLPAVEGPGGLRQWFKDGCPCRAGDDLPAVEGPNGLKKWFKEGQLHRDGGLPAVEGPDGLRQWYKDGQLHRDGGLPAVEGPDGLKKWFKDGCPYRAGGGGDGDLPLPAVEGPDGLKKMV